MDFTKTCFFLGGWDKKTLKEEKICIQWENHLLFLHLFFAGEEGS